MNNLILPEMANIWQETLNWIPTTEQQSQFQQLYELILEGNQKLNLTRITNPEEFWEKHLWDSLRGITTLLTTATTFIDLGTGAGFPGIPIAVAMTNSTVTLVDSTQKKIAFINETLTKLSLKNVKTFNNRAEEIGQQPKHRKNYDVALIRAVSTGSVCSEYALPLVKKGGLVVIYRGNWTQDETASLENAVKQLGGVIESIEKFTTPLTQSIRHCVYLRKIADTPAKFPRPVGIPTQKPL